MLDDTLYDRLTTKEAAALLRVTPRTLRDRRFRERIGLQSLYLGKRLRFRKADIKRLLEPLEP